MYITDREIEMLARSFREAIIAANENNEFINDLFFRRFPKGCCGDACYLLAEFFKTHGIETIYVFGEYKDQTHAWLVIKDDRINTPTEYSIVIPNDISLYSSYYSKNRITKDNVITTIHYEEDDIINGLIVDITADQFEREEVYIGYMNQFHSKFAFCDAHDYTDLKSVQLRRRYDIILRHI